MQHIITNKNTKMDIYSIAPMGGGIYIDTIGKNFIELAGIFSDPEETEKIDYYIGDEYVRSYRGFTVLSELSTLDDNIVLVALKKPEPEETDNFIE